MLVALRGGGNESTIQEQWHDIIASRHQVRVRQWLGATLGAVGAFLGLSLLGLPVYLSGAVDTAGSALLVGCFAGLTFIVCWAAVELSFKNYALRRRLVITGICAVLILAAIFLAVLRFGTPRWWHIWSVVTGLSILLSSAALAFNQISDLVDPMGWTSPYEQQALKLFL